MENTALGDVLARGDQVAKTNSNKNCMACTLSRTNSLRYISCYNSTRSHLFRQLSQSVKKRNRQYTITLISLLTKMFQPNGKQKHTVSSEWTRKSDDQRLRAPSRRASGWLGTVVHHWWASVLFVYRLWRVHLCEAVHKVETVSMNPVTSKLFKTFLTTKTTSFYRIRYSRIWRNQNV